MTLRQIIISELSCSWRYDDDFIAYVLSSVNKRWYDTCFDEQVSIVNKYLDQYRLDKRGSGMAYPDWLELKTDTELLETLLDIKRQLWRDLDDGWVR